jgi:hypothetical protein
MGQKSVNQLVNYTLNYDRNIYYLFNFDKLFEMRPSMFNAQLTDLRYRSTNLLAGLNVNILRSTRERIRPMNSRPL